MSLSNKDIIKEWKAGKTVDWRALSVNEKKGWLLACLFETGLPKGTFPKKKFEFDGAEIKDPVDLYCLLGEKFARERGYMGQDLDGLHDCLIQLEVQPGTSVIIKNHKKLAETLKNRFENYFSIFIDTLKEHGFSVELI